MGIDKETVPSSISVYVDNKKNYIKKLVEAADLSGVNDSVEEDKSTEMMLISNEIHNLTNEEYYFEDGELDINFNMESSDGSSQVYLKIPLSDAVLIDVLQYAVTKLNKLKGAMEALK